MLVLLSCFKQSMLCFFVLQFKDIPCISNLIYHLLFNAHLFVAVFVLFMLFYGVLTLVSIEVTSNESSAFNKIDGSFIDVELILRISSRNHCYNLEQK